MKLLGIILAIVVASGAAAEQRKPNYLITAPRVFRVGSTEKLSVSLLDTSETWKVEVELFSKRYGRRLSHASGLFQATDKNGMLELMIPKNAVVGGKERNAKLSLKIKSVNSSETVVRISDVITVEERSLSVFIQTDKPIYKPGQTIRMRVVGIDGNLKPLSGKITRVSVMDPNSVRMMQWDDVDFRDGMASLKMGLSSQPVLGEWKIEATVQGQKATQKIKVDKYVLPKFQVTIHPPSYVAVDSKEVKATVCAKYTYGQPVRGTLKLRIKVKTGSWIYTPRGKTITVQKEITGCTDLVWTNLELGLGDFKTRYWSLFGLEIEAKFTEKATGVTQNATKVEMLVEKHRVKLDLSSGTPTVFKPGMPFEGQLKVSEPDGSPLAGEPVTITARANGRERFQQVFTSAANGLVDFVINSITTEDTSLRIRVQQGNASASRSDRVDCYYCYFWFDYVTSSVGNCDKWHSPSHSYLTLKRISQAMRVGSTARINFVYSKPTGGKDIEVHYHVMSKGNMITCGSKNVRNVQVNNSTGEVRPDGEKGRMLPLESDFLEIPVTAAMVPSARVLVFYVRDDKETVADSMTLDVEDVLENQVSISFDEDEERPGQKTRLTVQAAPGSRVAIAAVDKSVHLLRAGNEITRNQVVDVLEDQDVGPGPAYNKRSCDYSPPWWRSAPFSGGAPRRSQRSSLPSWGWGTRTVDASKAFNDAGVIFFSNLEIETRPCPRNVHRFWHSFARNGGRSWGGAGGPLSLQGPVAMLSRPGPAAQIIRGRIPKKPNSPKKPPSIRSEFPETWLWTEEVVSEKTGQTVISAKVPDTITKWYASAFALSATSGMGVSAPTSLTAFQPFFVSFTLPYSVIRGEQVTIITTVFNYKSDCYTIRVDLSESEDIELVSDAAHKLCVCGNEANSAKFTIVPRRLGRVPLLVTAKDVRQNVCKGEQGPSLGVADAVSRKLLVEPEGVMQRYTYSNMVCLEKDDDDKFSDVMNLDLPENVVDGSTRAVISVIGDLMGPTLSVERFLRLPYGCGEQNMVNFAPNIYILQYLTNVGQLTSEIETKAQDFMMTGYQRELTYKRDDGSYSAFGNSDEEGNMWLTAFVLRSFAQARPFIFIDEKEIRDTVGWLRRSQQQNGCFPSIGRLFNNAMKGGVSGDGTRTAFVTVALLEAGVSRQDAMINKALSCMLAEASNLTDSYSTALFTYALTLANHARRSDFMKQLKDKAVVEDGLLHWENEKVPPMPDTRRWRPPYYRAPSADIEMTAYALMSYVAMSADDSSLIADAMPIIRWLSKQRNSLGGFGSTQDTCVGLQALAMYASKVYTNSTDLQIQFGDPAQQRFSPDFTVDENNRLVFQRAEIPTDLLPVKGMPVNATGEGCALVQADVSYNVLDVDEEPAFDVTVDVRRYPTEVAPLSTVGETGDEEPCGPLELNICAKWLREGTSNMAVIDVKLVSGFEADTESLSRLGDNKQLGLKRFELEGSNVIMYFDEITDLCFSFGISQGTLVKKTKPASVHVYDYYETDLSTTVKYSIAEELCSPALVQCPTCKAQDDLRQLIPMLCQKDRVTSIRPLKDGSAKVYASYEVAEFMDDPALVDTLHSTIVNRTTPVSDVTLVYPNGCTKCAASRDLPLLVFEDVTAGPPESGAAVTVDSDALVVGFTRLDRNVDKILLLKRCFDGPDGGP